MSSNLRSGAIGFAFGIALASVTAQAAQPSPFHPDLRMNEAFTYAKVTQIDESRWRDG